MRVPCLCAWCRAKREIEQERERDEPVRVTFDMVYGLPTDPEELTDRLGLRPWWWRASRVVEV